MGRRCDGKIMVLAALFLTACSAGGNRQVTSVQAPPLLPAHPSLHLVVNPVVADANDLLPDIRAALVAQLMAHGQFSQIVSYETRTDLLMTVEVTSVAKVSVGERMLLGLAGRNRVGVTVHIIDPISGVVIKSYDAEGNSAAQSFSAEAGISDAIRQLAKQVADGAAL